MRKGFTLREGATHVDTCHKVRKSAFTLAEVLITLGIIGVVAALTIPTLISEYQKKQWVSGLQKAITILNNGIQLMMVNEGVHEFTQLPVYKCVDGFNPSSEERACANEEYSKVFKIVSYLKDLNDEDFWPASKALYLNGSSAYMNLRLSVTSSPGFTTQDGITFFPYLYLPPAGAGAAVDVNGSKGPNQYGRDIFFLARNNGYFSVAGEDDWNDESISSTYCGDNNAKNGIHCSGRIKAEGWKMNY